MTASDMSMEHYERPEVRAAILALCEYGGGLRGLNGGDGWYVHQGDLMRLRGPSDFDDTISKERSLYMTADVFTPPVFDIWENRIEERGEVKPENTIGERGDLIAYSLFADIDAVKDPHDEGDEDGKKRSKLYHEGRIEALEAAASFMVSYLRLRGVSEAVGVLFSGQGIYVWLSPELSDMSVVRASPDFDRDKLDGAFKIWFLAFNDLLADIEKAFFEAFPEHVGRVKFDKLNNQKRKIKCLLSIHKTLPFAVVPLDRDDIRIDLEAAKIPLSSETIERAKVWLSTWKAGEGERSALVRLLEPYRQKAAEDVTAKAKTSGKIQRASEAIPVEAWCPFYQNLLEFPGGAGAHRVCGALATFLFQMGWSEEEAFQLWGPVAARCDVETRIFFTSFGVINSPNCETIKRRGTGYPALSFGELDLCWPDETCKGCHWPGDYGTTPAGAVRAEGGGYAADLPEGERLKVSCKKENWYVEVTGGAFKPVQISDKPIWFDVRKWEQVPEKLGIDPGLWDQIRADVQKLEERQADKTTGAEGPAVSEEIKAAARAILETGDPIKARCDYVSRTVEGNEGVAKVFVYSCSSAYMPASDKLHADGVGASQGGKTVTVGTVHSTYPPENLEILTEASPKSVYYLAKKYELEGRTFDDVIIYINDARTEHIPVLKVFRDDGPGSPRNLTVVDGESLDLVVPGRPVVQSSSVLPLRDDEGQAVSRSFLATVADVDDDGEKKVRGKIRQGLQYGALMRPEADTEKAVLQQMGRIIRDEGIREVVVPFDSPEPSSADRRGTGQFIRLIKISAHENQFQRPVLELKDGRRFVVATYADLQNAAEVWFEFEEAQAFKINHKVLQVFKALPTIEPDYYNFTGSSPSKNRIAKDTGISPKSVERYLSDLYDAELIYRKKASAPGNPYVFWTTDKMRQKVMSQISDTGDDKGDLGQIETKNGCLKYLGKNCPDSLKDSSKAFFNNQDILKKENVKGIYYSSTGGRWSVSGKKIISSLDFLANRVLNVPLEATDSEYLGQSVLSQMSEKPPVVDSKMGRIPPRGGGNVSKDGNPHQTIAENLAEGDRRQAEYLEKFRTPEPKAGDSPGAERTATPPPKKEGDPSTPEEAEALEVARSLQATGKRVTFGNVEAYLERAGEFVAPKTVKRVLNALTSQGWVTNKEGVLSEGAAE